MAGDLKLKLAASTAITITSANALASSTTRLAGASSASVTNATNLYERVWVGGIITMGAVAPTANKNIEVWIVPALDDSPTWPDVFAGTDAAKTVTSEFVKWASCVAGDVANTDATANQAYPFKFEIAQRCGVVPVQWGLFVTQDSGQALATSNPTVRYTGYYGQYT